MTDSDYLLAMIDTTFGTVPQIRAHHERMRAIAARISAIVPVPWLTEEEHQKFGAQQEERRVTLTAEPASLRTEILRLKAALAQVKYKSVSLADAQVIALEALQPPKRKGVPGGTIDWD